MSVKLVSGHPLFGLDKAIATETCMCLNYQMINIYVRWHYKLV